MFTSKQWKNSQFAKTKDKKLVENSPRQGTWKNLINCIKDAFPILKVGYDNKKKKNVFKFINYLPLVDCKIYTILQN